MIAKFIASLNDTTGPIVVGVGLFCVAACGGLIMVVLA